MTNSVKHYRRSLTALSRHPEAILVHGTVRDGVPFAWLDLGDLGVFNPEDRRVMSRDEFETRLQPTEDKRYSVDEAWEHRQRLGGWGPWE